MSCFMSDLLEKRLGRLLEERLEGENILEILLPLCQSNLLFIRPKWIKLVVDYIATHYMSAPDNNGCKILII